jgi:hypothetical protein
LGAAATSATSNVSCSMQPRVSPPAKDPHSAVNESFAATCAARNDVDLPAHSDTSSSTTTKPPENVAGLEKNSLPYLEDQLTPRNEHSLSTELLQLNVSFDVPSINATTKFQISKDPIRDGVRAPVPTSNSRVGTNAAPVTNVDIGKAGNDPAETTIEACPSGRAISGPDHEIPSGARVSKGDDLLELNLGTIKPVPAETVLKNHISSAQVHMVRPTVRDPYLVDKNTLPNRALTVQSPESSAAWPGFQDLRSDRVSHDMASVLSQSISSLSQQSPNKPTSKATPLQSTHNASSDREPRPKIVVKPLKRSRQTAPKVASKKVLCIPSSQQATSERASPNIAPTSPASKLLSMSALQPIDRTHCTSLQVNAKPPLPHRALGLWTEEESTRLNSLRANSALSWSEIAVHFPARTLSNIRRRYHRIIAGAKRQKRHRVTSQDASMCSIPDQVASESLVREETEPAVVVGNELSTTQPSTDRQQQVNSDEVGACNQKLAGASAQRIVVSRILFCLLLHLRLTCTNILRGIRSCDRTLTAKFSVSSEKMMPSAGLLFSQIDPTRENKRKVVRRGSVNLLAKPWMLAIRLKCDSWRRRVI